MATRSLRNRVSSRYTSPTASAETEAEGQSEERATGRNGEHNLEQWVEPPVRKLPPSYQDHRGLDRVGVLEMQEPLGVLPSAKILQKLKLNINRPSPRATPVQTEGISTPGAESEKVGFPSPVDAEMLSETPQQEEPIVISSPPRGRPAKRDIAEMKQSAYPLDVTPSPVKSSFTPSTHVSPKPHSIQEHLRQDRLQNYVERAIQEAEQRGDPGLVPGLQKIRDAAHSNNQLWNVLDAVVHRTPSDNQLKTFKRFIKKGVKAHQRYVQGGRSPYNRHSPSINSYIAPGQPLLPRADSFPVMSPSAITPRLAPTFTSPFRTRPTPPELQYAQSQLQNLPLSPSTRSAKMASVESDQTAPSPARKRTGSVSSSSSLSSVKSIPEDFAPTIEGDSGSQTIDGPLAQSNEQRQVINRAVAGKALRSAATNLPAPKHTPGDFQSVSKFVLKRSKKAREDTDYDPDEVVRRREEFEIGSYYDYNTVPRDELDERHHVAERDQTYPLTICDSQVPRPVVHPNPLNPVAALSSPTSAQAQPEHFLINGTNRKRTYDEVDKDDLHTITPQSSSPGPMFVPPPPAAVMAASRSATPRNAKIPPITKARKSARVMVSPNKPKNGGITAGIARAGPGRDSMIGNGADSGAEDNDEYCASCGGEGKLLCCDGCTNSFHHACLEPPLDPEEEVDGEWFCPRCLAKRNKDTPPLNGLLGLLIRRIDDTIPKAFALPHDIREYFEGVRTGDEGEYEDVGLPRTQNNAVRMNRAGFIDEPNYKELRDSKGKLITCYRCGLTANGRDIIPCDFCPARWHLDCVDPPLAIPPRRRIGDKPNATWRCPLHTEVDLSGLGGQAEAAPGDLGRVPRLRKPKNAIPIDVTMSRGFRNNGVIEVALMKDDMPEIKEIDMGGGTFRLPERGIRLDFIDRVKRSWYEDQTLPHLAGRPQKLREKLYRPDGSVLHHLPHYSVIQMQESSFFKSAQAIAIAETAKANAALRRKSFKEQQAVLNLAEFSQKGDIGYSGDYLADLTNQLVSEAPIDVAESIQRGELAGLKSLQDLIQRRLVLLEQSNCQSSVSNNIGKSDKLDPHLINGDRVHDYDDENYGGSEMDISE